MTLSANTASARSDPAKTDSEPGPQGAIAPPAEDAGLAALYRAESPRLVRLLSRQTRNRDDAEDIVQDAFFRIARAGGEPPALERPGAYLQRVAVNLLKDRVKSAARRSAGLHVVADEESLAGMDQQRNLEARDMLVRVEAAIMRLRPKTREIFMAHRVHGLSYEEIAERTGLTVKGVEKQMSKALVELHHILRRR